MAIVERDGRMAAVDVPELTTEAAARAAVQIALPLGKDPNTEPIIDARLADGSRVAICGPPAALTAAITIRRFGRRAITAEELTATGSLPAAVVNDAAAVLGRERNQLISGGTGSSKTTLLNAMVSLLPADGRIISIEDTLELRLRRANCLRFEARGLGDRGVTIRDLVRHALCHRPDHVVVGEVRGAEAADLLQALNAGHGGFLATIHANNAAAALSRLATCAMQASDALPWPAVCRGVVDRIEAVIHQTRMPEGVRRVDQMVSVRDYDATENRRVVEPIWPSPSEGARNGPSTPKRGTGSAPKRKRRGRGERGEPPACGRSSDRGRRGAGRRPCVPDAGGTPPVRADRVLRGVRALCRAGPCGAGGAPRVECAARCAAPAPGVSAMWRADGKRVDRLRRDRNGKGRNR